MQTLSRHRTAGRLATAGIALVLVLPGAALAATGHPTPVSDSSASVDCSGGPGGSSIMPATGKVAWLFVHAGVSHTASGSLTAVFAAAGTRHAVSYTQGGVKYLLVTDGPDTITSFWDTIDGGQLVLSHVCYGAQPSAAQSDQPSESPSQPASSPSETASQPASDTGCSFTLFGWDVAGGRVDYPMLKVNVHALGPVPANCTVSFSLNSYTAQGPTWPTSGTQALFDHQTITLSSAHPSGQLVVAQPPCYGQTDFYTGMAKYDGIDGALPHFPNVVTPAGLISYSNGGTACAQPSSSPSASPSQPVQSDQPSESPSTQPSESPSTPTSDQPSSSPSDQPSESPSTPPSDQPSESPSSSPSDQPSSSPSDHPSESPSSSPSDQPSSSPSDQPSESPSTPTSDQPSSSPSDQPSSSPSDQPSESPSSSPSDQPSESPSTPTSDQPSSSPSERPSQSPSASPSERPSSSPSGSVLSQTGVPQLTPPPTDTAAAANSTTGSGWELILLAAAGVIASLFTLTPAASRRRR